MRLGYTHLTEYAHKPPAVGGEYAYARMFRIERTWSDHPTADVMECTRSTRTLRLHWSAWRPADARLREETKPDG